MSILVTGANGQLGSSIRKYSSLLDRQVFFTDIDDLDITDKDAVNSFIVGNNIDIVINCAAYTNVDKAEDDYDKAELLNATAPAFIAQALKAVDGLLIQISTDYVFGGGNFNTPVKEDAKPSPTGVYGLTKLHGEEYILESGVNALIIRTSWLYSEYGHNFMKTILELSSRHNEIKVVFDQCGTPTYAGDLAKAIISLISKKSLIDCSGIYHYSNEGVCSWFDFAEAIIRLSGNSCNVIPCRSDEFPSKVVRPAYSVLDKSKIKETFSLKIPYWRYSLEECFYNYIKSIKS